MTCALATRGWSMGRPMHERMRIYISWIPGTFFAISCAILFETRLYILPEWLIGFLPLAASMLIGRCGVIKPLQRLPRPTEPSSPISAEVPVTVRYTEPFSMLSAAFTITLTSRSVYFADASRTFSVISSLMLR